MDNATKQQIERDPLAWLITAVGGTSKPRPCDENDHVAFTPNQHAQLRAQQAKTAAQRKADRKGHKTSQRARAHQAAICQRLGKPTPFQKGVRQ